MGAFSVFAKTAPQEIAEINGEITKIQNYISKGHDSAELKSELDNLVKRKNQLEQELAKTSAPSRKPVAPKIEPVAPKIEPVAPKIEPMVVRAPQAQEKLGEKNEDEKVDFKDEENLLADNQSDKISAPGAANYVLTTKDVAPEKADQKDPAIKLGAMLDFYYLWAPGRKQVATTLPPQRYYDRRNKDFTLNLLELNTSASFGKISVYADLDFGDFADQNQGHSSDGINHNIGQGYATYQFSDQLSLTAGKMYTHVGFELAKPMDNFNYSRSYAFSIGGPFWHEGLTLKYSHDSGFGAGVMV